MWNPLSTLPASNSGALSSFAPNASRGAYAELHPMYRQRAGLPELPDADPLVTAMGTPDATTQPDAFRQAMKAWGAQNPRMGMRDDFRQMRADYGDYRQMLFRDPAAAFQQYGQDGAPQWPGFARFGWGEPAAPAPDMRQQWLDWRAARPLKADF